MYILWINTVPLWSLVLQSGHTLLLFFLCFNMYKDHKAPQMSPGGFWWCGSSTEAIRCQSMELTTNTALWLGCEPTLPKSWGPIPRLSKRVSKDHLRSCVPKSFAGVGCVLPSVQPWREGITWEFGVPCRQSQRCPLDSAQVAGASRGGDFQIRCGFWWQQRRVPCCSCLLSILAEPWSSRSVCYQASCFLYILIL